MPNIPKYGPNTTANIRAASAELPASANQKRLPNHSQSSPPAAPAVAATATAYHHQKYTPKPKIA